MAVPIQNLRSGTATKRPAASGLAFGQVALNYNEADPAIYFRGDANALIKVSPVFVGTGAPNATPASGGSAGNSKGEQWLDTASSPPTPKIWDGSTFVSNYTFTSGTTLIQPTITGGTIASGTLSSCTVDGIASVGYKNIPPVGIKTSTYTLASGDVGKFVELGTSGSVTVPSGVFTTGDAISIFNNTSASISCNCSAVTDFYKGGTDADISSFSVTTRGVATIMFITATRAVVTGNLA